MNYKLNNTKFYLDSALKVNMYYDRLLFSIYNEKDLLFIYTVDHTKLRVLNKGTVTFDVLVNGKPEVINFCNIFYTPKLEYNLLSGSTIKKANYSILAKKKKR